MQFSTGARVLVLAALVALPGAAAAEGSQDSRRDRRFADMDRDKDGVITRTEWRGNDRSFRNHDWNGDGVLSGEEVRPGAVRRNRNDEPEDFDSPDREYELNDWTEANFRNLDHNRDNRLTRDEWHFDRESYRRADHDGDGVISRAEFLGGTEDDDREDRFRYLDENGDGRIARGEWHGSAARFDALDNNRDGFISRAEALGSNDPPADLFSSVDVNGDGVIVRDEWHWSRASFDRRDGNRDGRLSREEFSGNAAPPQQRSGAWRAGYDRGLTEGRSAGREDRERNQGWDLEGQRELETADSGYQAQVGSRAEYQAGYREGFRRGYREGWGK